MTKNSTDTTVANPYLRRTNNILSLIVVSLAVYIFIIPYLPLISFYLKKLTNPKLPYQVNVSGGASQPNQDLPKENTLVIPKIHLTAKVNEGKNIAALKNGVWHRPNTSSPQKGGNTVISGHRFTYDNQSFFYNLDKVGIGDKFALFWEGKQYDYEVYAVKTVGPDAVEIETHTTEPIVTLYTCTPLWSAKNRLVVQAKLLEAL